MAGRFLRTFGLVALVGMFLGSVGALLMLKERIHVTVAGEPTEDKAKVDPALLLRDDVASLRTDVHALADAMEKAFAETRPPEPAAPVLPAIESLKSEVEALRADAAAPKPAPADPALLAALRRVEERLDALDRRAAVTPAAAPPLPAPVAASAPPATALAPPKVSGGNSPTPPAPPSVTAASPAPSAAPAPAPAKADAPAPPTGRTFLSFRLPSETFSFAGRQRYEVLSSLSRVGFDGKSTLHDFSGATTDVTGWFVADLAQPSASPTGRVEADARTLDTGLAERNQDMFHALATDRFPTFAFELTSFDGAQADAKAMTVSGTAHGKMTIHGTARDVTIPLRMHFDEGKRLLIEGEAPLRLTDYGVVPPSRLGIVNMEDTVKVWLAIRARSVGRAP
jgi:polyisoprenoid-binding protein YceI